MTVTAREAYRAWAATYDDAPNAVTSLLNRNLEKFVGDTRGKRVVDVGCGTGHWVKRLGGIGVDLSFEMLTHAHGRVAQADALALPLRDASADIALCALTLAYVWPVSQVIEEMRRIVRPGGVIVAADLQPGAGWKRTFGSVEIENREYSLAELDLEGLTLEESRQLFFGDQERAIYESAGRMDLFERVRMNPVLWMRRWRR
jgi:ubiquinone/menaquinone biosynthesis C-methylase UbiE